MHRTLSLFSSASLPRAQVVGVPIVRRPLGPLRALLTGLALGAATTSAVGYVWLASTAQKERVEIAAALQELRDGAQRHRETKESLAALQRSIVALKEQSETKKEADTRAAQLRAMYASLGGDICEVRERVDECEEHLATALTSSPLYAMAKARAASARGRSWLERTGGPLAGLNELVDHPELKLQKSQVKAEKTDNVEKETKR